MSAPIDADLARTALSELPRGDNVKPGESVKLENVYVVRHHRNALDPESSLVVANRGMGKSLWAHALRDPDLRKSVALALGMKALGSAETRLAFHGGIADPNTPSPDSLAHALKEGFSPREIFHGVVMDHLLEADSPRRGSSLVERLTWMRGAPDEAARVREQAAARGHLVLLFDGLDRLGESWPKTRELLKGLLQVALEMQSTRTIRLKLFLRTDQFADLRSFEFPDSSKLRNTCAFLDWPAADLYGLLFFRLEAAKLWTAPIDPEARVTSLAGPFMGSGARRGRVFTWIPKHLADAHGQISPRTFLTVWREAAVDATSRSSGVPETAVDAKAIHSGVQRASDDRMNELREDYPWVEPLLRLINEVPLAEEELAEAWESAKAFDKVESVATQADRPIWMPLRSTLDNAPLATQLVEALRLIGVVERRTNGKIDVPDIFRVFAGIRRRGGVPPRKQSR